MSSKKADPKAAAVQEATGTGNAGDTDNAATSAWRVLHPVRHGVLNAQQQRVSRICKSGELIELTDAQAAPLLARGVIERAPQTPQE